MKIKNEFCIGCYAKFKIQIAPNALQIGDVPKKKHRTEWKQKQIKSNIN